MQLFKYEKLKLTLLRSTSENTVLIIRDLEKLQFFISESQKSESIIDELEKLIDFNFAFLKLRSISFLWERFFFFYCFKTIVDFIFHNVNVLREHLVLI